MHGSRIPIWFFIGLLLTIYGVMIFSYGIYEAATGNFPPGVQLTQLHTPLWWGGVLLLLGLVYVIKFRPGKSDK
jgi:heme/copper-type cytochrome/quinol oxidase subunit 3